MFIGFSFAIPTLIYASTSPLIYLLTSKIRKPGVICLGYIVLSIGLLLTGPSEVLGIYNSPAFVILGLAVMGFGCGLIIIPVMPDIIESVLERDLDIDENQLNNNVSGLFIAFQGIGETSGPIMGSVLEFEFGFRSAMDCMGFTAVFFCILYFLLCGRFSIFSLNKVEDTDKQSQESNKGGSYPLSEVELKNTTINDKKKEML